MSKYGVSLDSERQLKSAMRTRKIFEKDLVEEFIHASGPGGQNVNKVATCVQLHHPPTQITVKCQKHRKQGMNRFEARWLLVKKVDRLEKEALLKKQAAKAKQKARNRKRSAVSKERMLEQKKRQSEKKKQRQSIRDW